MAAEIAWALKHIWIKQKIERVCSGLQKMMNRNAGKNSMLVTKMVLFCIICVRQVKSDAKGHPQS